MAEVEAPWHDFFRTSAADKGIWGNPTVNETSATPTTARDRHLFGPGPKRLLALDGGGVRGAISVAFLERIEEVFAARAYTDYLATPEGAGASPQARDAKRRQLADDIRLGDHFDFVGGTSTGALIAGALALGYRIEQIKGFYLERAPKIFQRPFWRIPGLQAKFDARGLQKEIDDIVKDRTLDSPDLRTGLCVVTKRMDTGSPWIVSNDPRAPYWETKPADRLTGERGYIGNRHYKLATLVRASTAAPHFFDPEIIPILPDAEQQQEAAKAGVAQSDAVEADDTLGRVNAALGRFPRLTLLLTRFRARAIARRKERNTDSLGLFVDGGVTPFNNPSIALLMQVALQPYKICWPLGPDKLTFVSIGTGSFRTQLSFKELGFAGPLRLALQALLSMMTDTQSHALAQMQWLGECPDPWIINSELGTLANELPPGQRWFRFMRYDVRLEQPWLKKELGMDLHEVEVLRMRNMDDPGIIKSIYDLARNAAAKQVKAEHFFPDRTAGTSGNSAPGG
jgi:hypothetical protein